MDITPTIDDVLADLDRATELMLDGNCAPWKSC